MLDKFNLINSDAKVAFFLGLSEKVISKVSDSRNYSSLRAALNKCWEWLEHKIIEPDDLYWYLENLDDTGIVTLMQLEEDDDVKIWICIADALAFTIRCAYEFKKDEYLPSTIEGVEVEETIEEFCNNFNASLENAVYITDSYLNHLIENYPNSKEDRLSREEVINILGLL
ncbi:hypothetical protein D3C81_1535600 [compost metagenome]